MDAFCITIIENEKSYTGIASNVGQTIGIFISSTLFIPLNDIKWLNRNIYGKEGATTKPWITHQGYLLFVASGFFLVSFCLFVFVAEKKIRMRETNYFVILYNCKKILFKKEIIQFVLFGFLTTFFVNFASTGMGNKLLRNVRYF